MDIAAPKHNTELGSHTELFQTPLVVVVYFCSELLD